VNRVPPLVVKLGTGCEWTWELTYVEQHQEQHDWCTDATGLQPLGFRQQIEFFRARDTTDITCDKGSYRFRRGAMAGDGQGVVRKTLEHECQLYLRIVQRFSGVVGEVGRPAAHEVGRVQMFAGQSLDQDGLIAKRAMPGCSSRGETVRDVRERRDDDMALLSWLETRGQCVQFETSVDGNPPAARDFYIGSALRRARPGECNP
jgi:hypothetical protein